MVLSTVGLGQILVGLVEDDGTGDEAEAKTETEVEEGVGDEVVFVAVARSFELLAPCR